MAQAIRRGQYFYATVEDKPGEGYRLLEQFMKKAVNLLAFTAFPSGPGQSQLDFFPESADELLSAASDLGITMIGPKQGFLIQGEDEVGALVDIHRKLSDARINLYAGNAVCDGRGGYGYVLWVRPEDFENAARVLGV